MLTKIAIQLTCASFLVAAVGSKEAQAQELPTTPSEDSSQAGTVPVEAKDPNPSDTPDNVAPADDGSSDGGDAIPVDLPGDNDPVADDSPDTTVSEEDQPALPTGLEEDDEPPLPMGLGDDEPALPSGLEGDEPALPEGIEGGEDSAEEQDEGIPMLWKVVVDMRVGARIHDPINQRRTSIAEQRLQLHADKSWELWESNFSLTADFVGDPIMDVYDIDLATGDGVIDLREAALVLSPLSFVDLKIGRQTLTWGTGDLLFINDLFPKDWNAFIIGREIDYLKAPSDALKVSVFHSLINVDLIWTPRFDADRFPDRRRISSWDPAQGRILGKNDLISTQKPEDLARDGEYSVRASRQMAGLELAAYGYRGYWKSPAGMDPMTGEALFPELSVYGASLRGSVLGGIFNLESGYYDSSEDRSGDDPFVRNSEVRSLIGFERELWPKMTASVQYYQEYMRNHDAYEKSLPPGFQAADPIRHLVTLRLSTTAMRERIRAGIMVMGSPNEEDLVLLPNVSYALSDQWRVHIAANIFEGNKDQTFFGQLASNSNVSTGLRGTF